ncbi:MAG: hypothetical protein IT406_00765 [Candidatus Yanofskybacteria bacterium]|nr:hypothetical protein [Candidatus Yanofskybacteria bacterium]
MSDCPRFTVGQKVRLLDSPFLRRTIGHLAWAQLALQRKTVFTVVREQAIYGEPFVSVRGEGIPSHTPLNAHLFQLAE